MDKSAAYASVPPAAALNDCPFLKACRREKTPYTPVWFMRQAGRYMKDYRELREKKRFIELCKDKDLVTEITVTAQERLGTDAAIIFSDILLLVESFGMSLDYAKGDGPSVKRVIRRPRHVEALAEAQPENDLGFVFEAIRQTRAALKPDVPLIGFAGAPFTVASYMIEGGASEDFAETKKFMRLGVPWDILMEKITRATLRYVEGQVRAGVQAVQIFDSWIGCLSKEEYSNRVEPHSKALLSQMEKLSVPVIHFGTKNGHFLDRFSAAGGSVIGVDHRIGLGEAWTVIGYEKAIQGNLDPELLSRASLVELKGEVRRILKEAGGRAGHIFNLGHGVLPDTPFENAKAVVEMVHEQSKRSNQKPVARDQKL